MGKHKNRESLADVEQLEKFLDESLDSIQKELDEKKENKEDIQIIDVLEKRKKEVKRKLKNVRRYKKRFQTVQYSMRKGDYTMTPKSVPGGKQGAGTKRKNNK